MGFGLGKSLVKIAESRLRLATCVVLLGVVIGALQYFVHMALMETSVSIHIRALVGAFLIGLTVAVLALLLGISAREHHRRLLERCRNIAQLNHHVRNALQTIVNAQYVEAPEQQKKSVLESVERIDATLRELFPVIGERADDQRWKVRQIGGVRAFEPNRRMHG